MNTRSNNQEQLANARKWMRRIRLLDKHVNAEQETRDFLVEDPHRFVIYAVDTDVVMCYTNPRNLGLGSRSKRSHPTPSATSAIPYGVIFPPDENDEKAATAITYTIARYIFFHLNPQWPVFQLPAHNSETKQVFDAVSRKSRLVGKQIFTLAEELEEISEKAFERFSDKTLQILNQLKTADNDTNLDQSIEKILDRLEPLILNIGNSPVAELEHYLQLLVKGALLSTDDAPRLFKGTKNLELVSEALVAEGISDWILEAENRKKWIDLLEKSHPKPRKKHRKEARWAVQLEADANALTRLITINRKLEPLGGRMILITGAQAIYKAAQHWDPDHDFSRKYIRHFHSFVPHAFRKAEDAGNRLEQEEFSALRDIMGYRALSNAQSTGEKLDDRLQSILRKHEKAFTEIERDWISFRSQVTRSSITLSNDSVKRLTDTFAKLRSSLKFDLQPKNLGNELQKLARNVRKEILNARMSLAEEFAKTGIEYLQLGNRSGARNPPNIRFESYENADHIFRLFHGPSDLADISIRDELEKLKVDCKSKTIGITDLGYLHFLVFSGIFATLNRWDVAADLAGNAIEIAKQEPATKNNSHVSGREAYYLLASSLRLCARSFDDFDLADERINDAYRALDEDKLKRPEISISPLRFDAEKMAIKVGRWHFISSRSDFPDVTEEDLDYIDKKLDIVLDRERTDHALLVQYAINGLQVISLLLQKICGDNAELNYAATTKHEDDFLLQAILKYYDKVRKFRHVREDVFSDDTKVYLQETRLMKSYWLFADILLTIAEQKAKTGLLKKIEREFSELGIRRAVSTIYDKHRYQKLRKQCLELFEFSRKIRNT